MSKLLGIVHTSLILLNPVQQIQREQVFNNVKYGLGLGHNSGGFTFNNGTQNVDNVEFLQDCTFKYTINNDNALSVSNRITRTNINDVYWSSYDTLTTLTYNGTITNISLQLEFSILNNKVLQLLQNPSNNATLSLSFYGRDQYNNEYEPESNSKSFTLSKSAGDFVVDSASNGYNQKLYIYNINLTNTTLQFNNNTTWVQKSITQMQSLITYVEDVALPMYVSSGRTGDYTNIEAVDLTGLIFMILSMPFTFFKQAFDFTFFEGTPYAFNISSILLFIIAILAFIAVIKIIMPLIKGR